MPQSTSFKSLKYTPFLVYMESRVIHLGLPVLWIIALPNLPKQPIP